MKILIAGASGLIGQSLVSAWQCIHSITVLGRDLSHLTQSFSNQVSCITWEKLNDLDANEFDAVINLCGYNIADKRWSTSVKNQIISSRVETSKSLLQWIASNQAKTHYYSASAIGIYGLQEKHNAKALNENSAINWDNPNEFLSAIGVAWEKALMPAKDANIPVTITRFGVVLKRGEGFLKKLTPSFKLGLGAIIGDGQQMLSWIHHDDLVEAFSYLLSKPELTGPFNLCSPKPIKQASFAKAFAKTLHRPCFFILPKRLIRILFGEMGEQLINKGQKVIPSRLLKEGFVFNYPSITAALHQLFK